MGPPESLAVLWDMTSCSLVYLYCMASHQGTPVKSSYLAWNLDLSTGRSRESRFTFRPLASDKFASCSLLAYRIFDTEDGSRAFLRSVGQLLLNYTTSHSKRQHSSTIIVVTLDALTRDNVTCWRGNVLRRLLTVLWDWSWLPEHRDHSWLAYFKSV